MKGQLQSAAAHTEQPKCNRHSADLITQAGICQRLGISDETWRRWRARGITPPQVQLPGRPRWKVTEVEAFCAGRRWRNSHMTLASVSAPRSTEKATTVGPKAVGL